MRFPWKESTVEEQRSSRWLRWRVVAALLLVSAVPFIVVGSGAWVVFRNLAIERTLALQRNMARSHAAAIDMYLTEQLRTLEMITRTNTLEQLLSGDRLREVFDAMGGVHEDAFVDLGIIDERGRHLAYIGPFDLEDKTYDEAEWFQAVMAEGSTVSDVFLGYRQIPHSVIAIRQQSATGWWMLRATLDNRSLYGLVRSLEAGSMGDVFIVNHEGLYQTPPRAGSVLDTSSLVDPALHHGVRDQRLAGAAGAVRQVTTWLNSNRWLLVVQQPESEILAPVQRAVAVGALIVALALALVLIATILVTSHLIRQVELANQERDVMYADLIRSAKLASLGEMATGLAHEINNPLATISAEQTNLTDVIGDADLAGHVRESLEKSVARCKRQVERCGDITTKMLQFGRKTDTMLGATQLESALQDIAALVERRARANNVALHFEIEPQLPAAWLDANEFEQVVVNLVSNAIDAADGPGNITISATRDGDQVLLRVADDGCGVAPANLERIFQPFFTTKPVGQGTGLGLSVVYGIVRGWGGTINVDSAVGQGTTFSIRLPVADETRSNRARDLTANLGEASR
ncbi:MAG: hypothetical protein JSW71_04305 [Gemmatimonadota bacterium]|nr:MAG: hypothetical protein JSW71_04305 [Gemmatimonadota bacterium]